MKDSKMILGIDPGTLSLGYGIIYTEAKVNHPKLIQYGTLNLKHHRNFKDRLEQIWQRLTTLFQDYKPDLVVFESAFYAKNVQVMLKLGRVHGLLLAVAFRFKVPIQEYTPREIKQALTGNGNASKQQVAAMVTQILILPNVQEDMFDATDALSIALCAFYKKDSKSNKPQSWSSFIHNNPAKVKNKFKF